MKNLTITFDANDDLLQSTLSAIVEYNAEVNKEVRTNYYLGDCIEEDSFIKKYYKQVGLYPKLLASDDMPDIIERLCSAGHLIYVATSSPQTGTMDKDGCYKEHFPYFSCSKQTIIPIRHNDLLQVDVIVDDKIQNIIDSPCKLKLLVDKPWNQMDAEQLPGIIRVFSPLHMLHEIQNFAKRQKEVVPPVTQYEYSPTFFELEEQLPAFKAFASSATLPFVIGKDEDGADRFADLSSMRNILMVGEMMAGKSNQLHATILSMQHVLTSDQVKFLMIDFKTVEFVGVYKHSNYLYRPVVTNKKDYQSSLKDLKREVHRRLKLFAEAGVRSIEQYHQLMEDTGGKQNLPYIVVAIDEMTALFEDHEAIHALLEVESQAHEIGVYFVVAALHLYHAPVQFLKAFLSRFCFRPFTALDMQRTLMSTSIMPIPPLQGKGDGIAVWPHMQAFRFQGPCCDRVITQSILDAGQFTLHAEKEMTNG